jgi:hypothetical protein
VNGLIARPMRRRDNIKMGLKMCGGDDVDWLYVKMTVCRDGVPCSLAERPRRQSSAYSAP